MVSAHEIDEASESVTESKGYEPTDNGSEGDGDDTGWWCCSASGRGCACAPALLSIRSSAVNPMLIGGICI